MAAKPPVKQAFEALTALAEYLTPAQIAGSRVLQEQKHPQNGKLQQNYAANSPFAVKNRTRCKKRQVCSQNIKKPLKGLHIYGKTTQAFFKFANYARDMAGWWNW